MMYLKSMWGNYEGSTINSKYKIKKEDICFYIIYDVSDICFSRIVGTACTFLGAKRKMKKHAKRKKEKSVEYYFTENGVLINE